MDAFYVSCERRREPSLLGKPVVVGSDPKEGKGRGVVMAASYEARALGVRSGLPISQAWKAAPQAVYLPPDFDLYGDVSESVITVMRDFADVVEQASIDEAYLDVTRRTTWDTVRAHALAVKSAVREREGITCTVGAAPNKSCAKVAGEQQKPDGLTVVRPEEIQAFLDPLPVRRISGIGPKTEEERPDPKSISVERTFERDAADWAVVLETLDDVADNVWHRARLQKVRFRNIGIRIRFTGFETHIHQRTLPTLVDDPAVLKQVARELAAKFAERGTVRMVGVRVSALTKATGEQKRLL